MKTILFQNFSTPDVFVELTGFFPTPNMSIDEFKAHVIKWLDHMKNNSFKFVHEIHRDKQHNTAYYAMLVYLYDIKPTKRKMICAIDDMTLFDTFNLYCDTLHALCEAFDTIKPLTKEQEYIWVEKSGSKFWCYETGKSWCD